MPGAGSPEPRWARVSWGHPGQGLSVLPPGRREAGAGRTACSGLGPRGPTVPPRCGVVSVTPQPCLTWPGPFLRPEHKVSWHFYFLFTAFCFCVLQQAGNSTDRSPWRSRPRAARVRPGFWERGAGGPECRPRFGRLHLRTCLSIQKAGFPPPPPPANKFSCAFLLVFFRKGCAFVSIRKLP